MKSKRKTTKTPEQVCHGMAVGTGVAIGVVHRHDSRAAVHVREVRIPAAKVRSEQHRLLEAAARAAARIETLQNQAKRMEGAAGEELGYLLDAYHQMLSGSRLIRGVQKTHRHRQHQRRSGSDEGDRPDGRGLCHHG